jgi:hypothetical protein
MPAIGFVGAERLLRFESVSTVLDRTKTDWAVKIEVNATCSPLAGPLFVAVFR